MSKLHPLNTKNKTIFIKMKASYFIF